MAYEQRPMKIITFPMRLLMNCIVLTAPGWRIMMSAPIRPTAIPIIFLFVMAS